MSKQLRRKIKKIMCNSCKKFIILQNKRIPSNYCLHCGYPLPQTKQKLKKIVYAISNSENIRLKYKFLLLKHFKDLIYHDNLSKIIILLIIKKINKKNRRKLLKLANSI